MKRSSKIILAAVAATGISFATISWVSAQSGWGGNCNRSGPMQGQGYGMMNNQGYGPGSGNCQMQRGQGYAQPKGGGCAKKGYGRQSPQGGKGYGRMQGGAGMAPDFEGMKAQLQITADQESAWKDFEEVINLKTSLKAERMAQRGAMRNQSVEDRTARMRQMAGHMTMMADALDNLNAALSDEQKALFSQMSPRGRMR